MLLRRESREEFLGPLLSQRILIERLENVTTLTISGEDDQSGSYGLSNPDVDRLVDMLTWARIELERLSK